MEEIFLWICNSKKIIFEKQRFREISLDGAKQVLVNITLIRKILFRISIGFSWLKKKNVFWKMWKTKDHFITQKNKIITRLTKKKKRERKLTWKLKFD